MNLTSKNVPPVFSWVVSMISRGRNVTTSLVLEVQRCDPCTLADFLGEREMFYLTTHSTHFIYGYMASDHSDGEKGNPLPPHRLKVYCIF